MTPIGPVEEPQKETILLCDHKSVWFHSRDACVFKSTGIKRAGISLASSHLLHLYTLSMSLTYPPLSCSPFSPLSSTCLASHPNPPDGDFMREQTPQSANRSWKSTR